MALGRETVGTAYIRILADGSGLDRSIKEEIRKSDDGVRAEGARQGDAYADEFGKRLSQKDIGKGLRENLERSQAKTDVADAFFDSANWKKFVGRLKKEYGDAGIVAARELQDEFRHETDEQFVKSTTDIGKRMDRIREEMAKPGKDFERNWRKEFDKIGADIERFAKNAGDGFEDASRHIADTEAHLENLGKRLHDGGEDMLRWHRQIQGSTPIFARYQKQADRLSDGLGRMFGRGARNNFVNFVGSVVRGLSRIFTSTIPRVLDMLVVPFKEAITEFQDLRKNGELTFQSLAKIGTGLVVSLAQLPLTIAGIVLALGGLALAIGPIIGALSLLLGTVIALTSSIAFGLAGALAPLVGLLGPIGVAAAAVGFSFIGMDTKTKKLMKESLEPLKDDLEALGDAARPGILRGLQAAVDNLRPAMRQLQPLFAAAGDGVATFAGAFTDAMTGPGLTRFENVMGRQLPGEMQQLGDALGHVFDGFLGALASLNRKGGPVEQFLGWLTGITATFDDWTSQKAVAPSIDLAGGIRQPSGAAAPETGFEGWMAKIEESATALKGVLNPLWDIVRQLLNAGKPTGDSLLTSLGDTLQDLADWMTEHPDDVDQWFQDAGNFARALGQLAVSFAKLADELDTPEGRKATIWLVKVAGLTFGASAFGVLLLAKAFNALAGVDWDSIGGGFGDFFGWFGKLQNKKFPDLKLGEKLKNAIGKVHLKDIIDDGGLWKAVVGPFTGVALAEGAFKAIGKVHLKDIVDGDGIWKAVVGPFVGLGLADGIKDAIGKVHLSDLVDSSGIYEAVVGPFVGLGLADAISDAIGTVMIHLGVDTSRLPGPVRAALGNLFVISNAAGGVFDRPTFGMFGEAGAEAIVPLDRPLALVDPAVRELSAIAQGLTPPRLASGGVATPRPTIDASGWQIITPTEDPAAVASEVINRLVAVGY